MRVDKQPVLKGRHSDEFVCSAARCGLPFSRAGETNQRQAVDEAVCRPMGTDLQQSSQSSNSKASINSSVPAY